MVPYSGFYRLVRNISIPGLIFFLYLGIISSLLIILQTEKVRLSQIIHTISVLTNIPLVKLVWICLLFAWPNAPTHSLPSKTHMVLFCLIILFPLTCIDRLLVPLSKTKILKLFLKT